MFDLPIGNSFTESDYTGASYIFFSESDYNTIQAKTASNVISAAAASAFDSSLGYKVTPAFFIESVNFALMDHHMLTEYFGDTFTALFFGRSPMILECAGKLSSLKGSNTKRNFMALYRDVLRLRKVARTGIVPCISFTGAIAKGAFVDLHLENLSAIDDFYPMAFRFLVFEFMVTNSVNKSGITKLDIRYAAVN